MAELADAVELSPSHFHRLFKRATGLTPKAYAAGHRADRVRKELGGRGKVTAAIYDAGFNSSGRFYEEAAGMLGMTPTKYKAGGVDEELHFAIGESSLGAILGRLKRQGCGVHPDRRRPECSHREISKTVSPKP